MSGRLVLLGLVAIMPSPIKRFCYRFLFGYRIGRRVRIGVTILDAARCDIGDDVTIGHLNVVTGVKNLTVGDHARIGHLNIIRGGDEVRLGRYIEIGRLNEINSIPNPRVTNPVDPRFVLGDGACLYAGHKIDFTDRVEIGRLTVVGGRNSSFWTHNRQKTLPVTVGPCCYLGSEIRMAPGSTIPARCIVGLGSVVVSVFEKEESFIAGVPARAVRALDADDIPLLEWKSRPDLPDDL